MKNSLFIVLISLILAPFSAFASREGIITGKVTDSKSNEPITGAVLKLDDGDLWSVTGVDGEYEFRSLQDGLYLVEVSCLGYVTFTEAIYISKGEISEINGDAVSDVLYLDFALVPSSLALDEVVVTAQRASGINTSFNIDRNALNHLQMSNMSDISALLPGGKTINPDLTTENSIDLRSSGTTVGNSAFGTAMEVDGVRINSNSGFGEMGGTDTRNIAVDNIESVEVITGVPSAEYGDLGSGMVKINTRKGRTPVNVMFTVNPKTWQTSVSKGFDLGENNGIMNVSAEWTRATSKLTSPYTSYTRRNISASYTNTFNKVLRWEIGLTGNIGGMNSEDDPDAFTGAYEKVRDNVFRGNTSLTWLLNRPWISNLEFEASVNFNDNLSHVHSYNSEAISLPSVHSELEGYFWAGALPATYYADQIIDSKELNAAASLKYSWTKRWNDIRNNLKAGIQWNANGNTGEGEYYLDPTLAANGYRPRPYRDYPFMHNLSGYIEDNIKIPIASTLLEVTAGLRMENVFVKNSRYEDLNILSPRFNAKWTISDSFAVRGGWGITGKLPSFYVLYPRQQYRDIQTFAFSHSGGSSYLYYTQPYTLINNPELKWQRNVNAELGIETILWGTKISLVGYYNVTKDPYSIVNSYSPFSYNMASIPEGFSVPADPQLKVDSHTGTVYMRGSDNDYWTPMNVKVTDRTFVRNSMQYNDSDVKRAGIELVMDFPEISAIRTSFRFDAAYCYSKFVNEDLLPYYNTGWSHTSLPNRSYQYVGIYAGGYDSSVANGKVNHNLDANITAITHIPQARIIITCRLEASLFTRTRNLSEYNGKTYAYTVTQTSNTPTGGDIFGGNSYTAIRPVKYMDLDGNVHDFTDTQAADPEFANLILKSGNIYTFAQDGYGAYLSANLSITKEIGDHVSLSFFANNFTNSRMSVRSIATGVSAVFTPAFYYGLSCRLKF